MNYVFIINLLAAIFVTAILLLKLPRIGVKMGLVDHPDERKQHAGKIPLVGGIAMFLGFGFTALTLDVPLHPYRGLFAGAILLIIVGVLDDLRELSSTLRFTAQILAAIFMAEWGGVRLIDLGLISPEGELIKLNWWSSLLTVFATVGVINAMNMIDGLDRLAASLAIVTISSLILLTYASGNFADMQVLLILLAVVATFVYFNRTPSDNQRWTKVFMGDSGSMLLGFVLCWFFIHLSQGQSRSIYPVTALWIFAIPLIDTVSQMLRRTLKGESPFSADRQHIHHRLLHRGFSPDMIVLLLSGCAILMAGIGIAAQIYTWPQTIMFYGFLGCFGVYFISVAMTQGAIES